VGLDAVWLARSISRRAFVMSAPLTVLAVIAGQTNRVKTGHWRSGAAANASVTARRGNRDRRSDSRGRLLMGIGRSGNRALTPPMACRIRKPRALFRNTGSAEACLDATQFFVSRQVPSFRRSPRRAEAVSVAAPADPHRRRLRNTFPVLGALGYPLFVAVRSGSLGGLAPIWWRIERLTWRRSQGQRRSSFAPLAAHRGDDAEAQAQARESTMAGYKRLVTQLEGSRTPVAAPSSRTFER